MLNLDILRKKFSSVSPLRIVLQSDATAREDLCGHYTQKLKLKENCSSKS